MENVKKEKKKRAWWKKMLIALGAVVMVLALAFVLFINFWRPVYVAIKNNRFEKELAEAQMGEIVFFGDSITDMYDAGKYYPEYTIYNRGISGDATFHLLGRMNHVYDLQPSVIVLLIGTNDFMNEHQSVADTAADYEAILQGFAQNCPDAVVICQSVYPGGDEEGQLMAPWQEATAALNVEIEKLAGKYGCTYADVYSVLKDGDALRINPLYTKDGVHPNEVGYDVITEYLKPFVERAYAGAKN